MAFTEDLTVFFDTDDFGVVATIGAASVNVIFDNAYLGIEGETVVAATQPMVYARTSDVSSVVAGNTVIVNSVTYTVVGVHPDGTGVTQLILRR